MPWIVPRGLLSIIEKRDNDAKTLSIKISHLSFGRVTAPEQKRFVDPPRTHRSDSGFGQAAFYVAAFVKPSDETAIVGANLRLMWPALDWRWWLHGSWGTRAPNDLLSVPAASAPTTQSRIRLEADCEALRRVAPSHGRFDWRTRRHSGLPIVYSKWRDLTGNVISYARCDVLQCLW
jgi:hypothetical protein